LAVDRREGRLTTIDPNTRRLASYALVALAVVAASIGGYLGYVLYPRFDMPGVSVLGLYVLAVGAGVACFFSPCSFPLLVSLFGRGPGTAYAERPGWRQTIPFAAGLSLGAAIFLLIIGLIVALVGTAVFAGVVFTSTEGVILRSVIGVLLIILGLIQIGILRVPLPPVQDLADPLIETGHSASATRSVGRSSIFGFGYLVAGFG
jgi:cytochrome c biogenesis protein CcdA